MAKNSNGSQQWQYKMFIEGASEFIEILKYKSLTSDITLFIHSLRSQNQKRFAILDLGCGVGRLFPYLSEVGTIVVGSDYSPPLVAEAVKTARMLPNVTVVLHDMKNLRELFPPKSFDLVIRAYTSLGYFPPDIEADILDQCHELVVPGGRLVVDTFNSEWFRKAGALKRSEPLHTFELEEEYNWDTERDAIRCMWRYKFADGRVKENPFRLDGYDISRIDRVLGETGWKREGVFQDLSLSKKITDTAKTERLIILAGHVS